MAYHAIHRFARIAPRKARLVAELIRGRRIDDAMTELRRTRPASSALDRHRRRADRVRADVLVEGRGDQVPEGSDRER